MSSIEHIPLSQEHKDTLKALFQKYGSKLVGDALALKGFPSLISVAPYARSRVLIDVQIALENGIKDTNTTAIIVDEAGEVTDEQWKALAERIDAVPDYKVTRTAGPSTQGQVYQEAFAYNEKLVSDVLPDHTVTPAKDVVHTDSVLRPSHYNKTKIQPIEVIADWNLDGFLGPVVKYVARAPHKGAELEDLKKARRYLDMKINVLEGRPVLDGAE